VTRDENPASFSTSPRASRSRGWHDAISETLSEWVRTSHLRSFRQSRQAKLVPERWRGETNWKDERSLCRCASTYLRCFPRYWMMDVRQAFVPYCSRRRRRILRFCKGRIFCGNSLGNADLTQDHSPNHNYNNAKRPLGLVERRYGELRSCYLEASFSESHSLRVNDSFNGE